MVPIARKNRRPHRGMVTNGCPERADAPLARRWPRARLTLGKGLAPMVPIARRNLLAEKLRLAIAVGGVGFAVFLIVTIQSLYQGFRSSAGEFVQQFPADLWVAQRGMADLANSTSHVPLDVQPQIAGLPGVRAAVNAQGRFLRLSVDGR